MLTLVATLLATGTVQAEVPGMSLYGIPGHVEMPSAIPLPDGNLGLSINMRDDVLRSAMSFQISPRLTGTFRYSYLKDYLLAGGSLYDRSFDLRYQIAFEGAWTPAVAVGLQDFGGTGIWGAEYLVASKHFGPDVTASAGIGWGRFGSYGSFSNPLGVITDRFDHRGDFTGVTDTGQLGLNRFFRGDAALFFGVDWQVNDRLRLSAEYSSDDQTQEQSRLGLDHRTPVNLGAEYRLPNGSQIGLAYLYGSTLTLSYTHVFDLARSTFPSGREPGPPAVIDRDKVIAGAAELREARIRQQLDNQGQQLAALKIEGDTSAVEVTNQTFPSAAQAMGRTARVMSREMPPEISQFRIRQRVEGVAVSDVTFSRSDIEELEHAPDGAWQSWARARAQDARAVPDSRDFALPPPKPFSTRLSGYFSPAIFDPDNPVRADLGLQAEFEWQPLAGLVFSGAARKKVIGNRDESTRMSDSVLEHVRSDSVLYDKNSDPEINWLTVERFDRPAPNFYTRFTAGILERMYGGVSSEVLWAPFDSPLALGAELNYVRQRDYNGGLGFLDYKTTTGHISAWYDFQGGYIGQIDVGRYLAGDWGSTLTLTRRFGNGIEIGAFATLTDVSFDDYGEGSFDKGISIRIPISWLSGDAARDGFSTTIRPIMRDGGARLDVRNRLYYMTRDYRGGELGGRWGRFWR